LTLVEATQRLREVEREAIVAVRTLASAGYDHLLAEVELEVPLSEADVAQALKAHVDAMGAPEATRTLWRLYPATCALYTSDAGRREYEHGALYPAIGAELGLSQMQVVGWGDKFLEFLDTISLERFWSDDLIRFRLESILLHGGLPDDAWTQIWQSLILPAVEAGFTSKDARDVVEHALAKSWTAPQLRKTTQHILDNGGSLIVRLIANALAAAQSVKTHGYVDDQVDYRLPQGAIASLQQVLEAPRLHWPELRLDESRANPIYLHCPEQMVARTPFRTGLRADYRLYAVGDNTRQLRHDEIAAHARGQFLHIDETSLALDTSGDFDAVIRFSGLDRSGQPREKRLQWRESAISGVWVFALYRKRWVSAPVGQRQRPFTEAVYVVPSGYRVSSTGSARVVQTTPLTGAWAGRSAYRVEAPEGGSIEFRDSSNNRLGDLPIGQKCAIALRGDQELAIGCLIMGEPAPRVYGKLLPTVSITPLDLSEPIGSDDWSCRVEWTDGGKKRNESVRFVAEGPYRLEANLNDLDDALGPVVGDALLRVEGPSKSGSLTRRFARAPITRPQPVEIRDAPDGDAQVVYQMESMAELPATWRGQDVRALPPTGDGAYRFVAPLSKAKASLTVRMNGNLIPMNLSLLGIDLAPQGVDELILTSPVVPADLLTRYPNGFLRLHCENQTDAQAMLISSDTHQEQVLRAVGRESRRTDTVALAEIHSLLVEQDSLTIELMVEAGDLKYRRRVMSIVPGVGLGLCELLDDGDGITVRSESSALAPVTATVRDLTRPWRDPIAGVFSVGETSVRLQPRPYDMYEGRYGLWLALQDEWGMDGQSCSSIPNSVTTITADDHADANPPMGPYMTSLTSLLMHRQGLAPKAQSIRRTSMPSLGMLEVDAKASVWAAMRVLDPTLPRAENSSSAAKFGTDVIDLRDYRYALCPPVLRALLDPSFASCASKSGLLGCMLVLHLPLLPLRRANSGEFTNDEIGAAWRISPVLGALVSQMHAQVGPAEFARQAAINWLDEIGLESLGAGDMLGQLHVCHHSIASASARDPIQPLTKLSRTSSTRAFGVWIEAETTASVRDTSCWLAAHIEQARSAVTYLETHSPGLRSLATAIQQRDPGEYTRRIDQLPFVSGAAALVATAQAYADSAASRSANIIGGDHAADISSVGLNQVLLDLCSIAPTVLSHDLALIRLAAEKIQMGDLV